MEINGRKVTGIFIYDTMSLYDQGDLVLYGTTLYIVNTKVSGENPDTSDKYTIYLGDKYVDYTEYLNYTYSENPTLDKYISVKTLPAILNHYLTGVNIKGEIQEIDDTPDILDTLIMNPEINFAIYSVPRKLEELRFVYSGKLSVSQPDNLILKQYTYTTYDKGADGKVEKTHTMRVQELIDHSQYIIWYRNCEINKPETLSDWGNVSINMTHLNDRIKSLQLEYESRMDALRNVITELKGNFRYRNISNDNPSNSYDVPMNLSDNIITIGILSTNKDNNLSERSDLTIDLSSSLSRYKSGNSYVLVSDLEGRKKIQLFSDSNFSTPSNNSVIDIIILHQYYE